MMTLTSTIIRSFALTYTEAELKDKLLQAHAELEKGSVITSATSGGGTSYARTITLTPAEAVELYQRALDLRASSEMVWESSPTQTECFVERTVC